MSSNLPKYKTPIKNTKEFWSSINEINDYCLHHQIDYSVMYEKDNGQMLAFVFFDVKDHQVKLKAAFPQVLK